MVDGLATWDDASIETGADGSDYLHVRMPGSVGKYQGVFHSIIDDDGMVTHRMFEKF
jgi:hypothetical protein